MRNHGRSTREPPIGAARRSGNVIAKGRAEPVVPRGA
jgi:hypothetical protein